MKVRSLPSMASIAKALVMPVTAAVLALYPTYHAQTWFIAVVAVLGVLGIYSPSATNAGQASTEARLRALEQAPRNYVPPRPPTS